MKTPAGRIDFLGTCLALLAAACATPGWAAETLVEAGRATEWRYLDNGQRPNPAWMRPDFDDRGWPSGLAPLGFGEPDISTSVRFGGNPAAKAITTYFRHTFVVPRTEGLERARLFIRVDDGALIFLNGREIGRVNLPPGDIGPGTTTTAAIGGDAEQEFHEVAFPASALAAGRNVLAIEVHQCDGASTDLYLDLRLKAYAAGEQRVDADNPHPRPLPVDPVASSLALIRRGDIDDGVAALAEMREDNPKFLSAMLQAGQVLAEELGRPEVALPLVERAYRRAPQLQPVAYAWARTQLLARTNLRVPFESRPHPATVAPEWKWIVDGPRYEDRSAGFSRAALEADLDYLETMIANGYSYAERRRADWRAALDAVRASLEPETPVNTFARRLQRVFTVFGDPHSGIRGRDDRPGGYLPFLTADAVGDRVVALSPDRTHFLDHDHPYLRALDGRPIAEWLREVDHEVPQASPQFRARETARLLGLLNYWRMALGLPLAPEVRVLLETEDGRATKEVSLPIANRLPRVSRERARTGLLADGIACLRIASMAEDKKFLDGLDETMRRFRDTRGLVIDVRDNGGGTQDALWRLMPYFLAPDRGARIVNVAAYRIPVRFDRQPRDGFLLANRHLHPVTAATWTPADRDVIREFLRDFRPNWTLPAAEFSDWHVMAIRPETNPRAFYYGAPVVILSNAGCFSATDNFLGAFKGVPNITVMGTASGGGSGRMAPYVLLNTKLLLMLCQMASFRRTGELYDGAGVEPDIVVEPQPTDHLNNGRDRLLDAAIENLRSRQRPASRRRRSTATARAVRASRFHDNEGSRISVNRREKTRPRRMRVAPAAAALATIPAVGFEIAA